MNAVIVTRTATTPQPTAWQLGFEDASAGKSIWFGYYMFVGPQLTDYKAGWLEGQRVADAAYVPFQHAKEAYGDIRSAEDREDWIGE